MENEVENVYYEQLEHSTYDSLCTKPDFLESEVDVSDYDSPSPLDYEIPDQSTEAVPEIQKREPVGPSSYSLTLPRKDCDAALVQEDRSLHAVETEERQKLNLCKLYTTLTHTHVPSVYCTPSHSMEFKTNAARISNSTLDIVNLESSGTMASPPPTPLPKDKLSLALHRPYRHYSRAKVAVSVFLVTAIAVAMIALGVSIVAVFVVTEGGETTISESEAFTRDNITSLQAEIRKLQREVEQARNETSGTLELSSLYQNCQQETQSQSCSSSTSEGPVCLTDPLPLEKRGYLTMDRTCYAINSSDRYTLTTSIISSDSGASVYCQCRVEEAASMFIQPGGKSGIGCVLMMLRCPLQQTLEVVLDKN